MYGVVLQAHPVHGESHKQRNTTGEVATLPQQLKPTQRKSDPLKFPFGHD